MGIKLYEMVNEFRLALDDLMSNEGLTEEVVEDSLSGLKADIEQKAINVGLYIKEIEAEAAAVEAAAEKMRKKHDSLYKKADRLKEYLLHNLRVCSLDKVRNELITVRIKQNPAAVKIDNEESVPNKFKIVNIEEKPDLRAIKEEILRLEQSGDKLEWARLESKVVIEIK